MRWKRAVQRPAVSISLNCGFLKARAEDYRKSEPWGLRMEWSEEAGRHFWVLGEKLGDKLRSIISFGLSGHELEQRHDENEFQVVQLLFS